MSTLAEQLKKLGHEAKSLPTEFTDGDGKLWRTVDYHKFKKTRPFNDPVFLKNHSQRIHEHFNKVVWSDAVLIANYDKNNIPNYIGPNTLMEMGLAFHLGKKIYLLNEVPETAWKEEVLGMRPLVLNGDLSQII
jgi:hypothetical protein